MLVVFLVFVHHLRKMSTWISLLVILPAVYGADQGGARDAPPRPISFIFTHFSAKFLPNNRLASGAWHPLGNPESLTGIF